MVASLKKSDSPSGEPETNPDDDGVALDIWFTSIVLLLAIVVRQVLVGAGWRVSRLHTQILSNGHLRLARL